MTGQIQKALKCPSDEIAAYIDGEMERSREIELEEHVSSCDICSLEMTQQKQFLCGLSSRLKHEDEIELPPNFTKLIVAKAESTVTGLRRPRERFNAIFICAGLFLFALFALGAEAGKAFDGVSNVLEQMTAVSGFFGHLIYSFLIGVAIILRALAAQIRVDVVASTVAAGLFAISVMAVSRRLLRILRT